MGCISYVSAVVVLDVLMVVIRLSLSCVSIVFCHCCRCCCCVVVVLRCVAIVVVGLVDEDCFEVRCCGPGMLPCCWLEHTLLTYLLSGTFPGLLPGSVGFACECSLGGHSNANASKSMQSLIVLVVTVVLWTRRW